MDGGDSRYVTAVRSYRYLRLAMVAMLGCLAAATVIQTVVQDAFLASISAYYYTPAQAIFVGVLIAVGVCMVALLGTTTAEDVLLNLGGMLAAVVAIVPTARSADFTTAVRACRQGDSPLLSERATTSLDCPTVRALAEATRANVENNMTALLAVGGLALLVTLLTLVGRHRGGGASRQDAKVEKEGKPSWWAVAAVGVVYLLGAATFVWSPEWFIDYAHYIAAAGLFVCMVAVVVANAWRAQGRQREGRTTIWAAGAVLSRPGRYVWIALLMVAVLVAGVLLLVVEAITVFWLETAVIALFALFWMVQTFELWNGE